MSGALLFDTCVLIDCLRGHEASRKIIETTLAGKIRPTLSVISSMELQAGSLMDNPVINEQTEDLVSCFNVLPITDKEATTAGLLLRRHRSQGLTPMDALVAATALENGAVLITRNVKHFRIIHDLVVLAAPLE